MKKIWKLLPFLICLILLVSCSSDGEKVPDGMQAVNCDGLPYRAYMPAQWEARRVSDHIEARLPASAPVGISVRHFKTDETDVDAYWANTEKSLRSIYQEYQCIEKTPYSLAGMNGIAVSYRGNLNEEAYRFLQAIAMKDGYAYVVTYSAQIELKTGSDLYGNYVDDAYRVIDNLSLQTVEEGSTEEKTDLPSTDDGELVEIGKGGANGNVRFYVPSGWTDESYGTFAFAVEPNSRSSVSLCIDRTETETYPEYWQEVAEEILTLYPNSQFNMDAEDPTKYAFEEVTLDGVSAEKITYLLVTDRARYECVKIAFTDGDLFGGYQLYVLTFMFPVDSGIDAAAIEAQICDAVRIG